MKRIRSLAFASLFVLSAAHATTITENFTNNPLQNGWQVFGNTNLFQWNSVNQNLAVTWDSTQMNSYFYHPLGMVLARDDDFGVAFDLRLNDFLAGIDPQMPGTFPLSVGFLNLAEASQPGFLRGTGHSAPHLAEFSFFPDPGGAWIYGPSLTAVMIDSTGFNYSSGGYDPDSLTTDDIYRVNLNYTASNCNLVMTITRNLKRWREENLAKVGLRGIFPIWKIDSRELIREFFTLGFGSVICCTNDAYLGEDAVGRNIDAGFIAALPPEVDPCGENGEFHSFAFAGPIFKQPVKFKVGEKVYRPVEVTHPSDSNSSYVCPAGPRRTKGFWFCDLLPDKS